MAKKPSANSRRRTDPGEAHYKAWKLEQEACIRYGSKKLKNCGFQTPKEASVACLYEYAREVVFEREVVGIQDVDIHFLECFFMRRPFQYLIDGTPESCSRLRSTPWHELPLPIKGQIIGAIGFSYDKTESNPIPVQSLTFSRLIGTFDKFNLAADEKLREYKAARDQNDYDKCLEIVQQPSVIPIGEGMEQVVVLIDYRHKKKAVLEQFKDWLDSRDELFTKHSAEVHGGRFFQDRLRDLANWRLHRHLGMKGLDALKKRDARLEILLTNTSYSEAKKRAVDFTRLLCMVRFQDLKELEIAFHQHSHKNPG